jgi:hypothetical protein
MARKTQRQLAKLLRDERVSTPAADASFRVEAIDKKLRFLGFVTIGGTEYEAAASNGKIATFGDVDAFVRYCASCVETGTGTYPVAVDTAALLVKSPPSDLVAWAADEVVRLGVRKTAQQGVLADIAAQLALMAGWESGNALQRAKKLEVQAQQTAVNGDIAAIDAEVARLTP